MRYALSASLLTVSWQQNRRKNLNLWNLNVAFNVIYDMIVYKLIPLNSVLFVYTNFWGNFCNLYLN